MGSTVYANGFAVATASSSHVAHCIAVDVRLNPANGAPVPKWNKIKSDYLTRNTPVFTQFDSALIWTSPSEVGDPPKSEPIDGWVGAVSGAINSYAKALPGQGSANVFVEGNKVIRHTDMTFQNASNSMGIIDNAADAAAAEAKFNAEQAAKDAAGKTGKSESKGKADGESAKGDEGEGADKKNEGDEKEVEHCTLVAVNMIHVEATLPTGGKPGDRKQSGTPKSQKAHVEVVGSFKVELEGEVEKNCGEHAAWSGEPKPAPEKGEKTKAEKGWLTTASTTSSGDKLGAVGAALTLRAIWNQANAKPKIFSINGKAHDGNFDREIWQFPMQTINKELKFEEWKNPAEKIAEFLKDKLKLPIEVKFLEGAITVVSEWKQNTDYRAYWECRFGGKLLIIELSIEKKFDFTEWKIPQLVPAQLTYALVNAAFKAVTGNMLATIAIGFKFSLGLETSLSFGAKKFYTGGNWKWSGQWTAGATATLSAFAELAVMGDVFKANVNIGIGVKIEGIGDFTTEKPALPITLAPPFVTGGVTLSWDLTKLALAMFEKINVGWVKWLSNKVSSWAESAPQWAKDLAAKSQEKLKGEKKWEFTKEIPLWQPHVLCTLPLSSG